MANVFGREHPGHGLESELAALESPGSSPECQAVAWNLRNDWRVGEARERAFTAETFTAPVAPGEPVMRRRLTVYQNQRVRSLRYGSDAPPHFVLESLNGENRAVIHRNWPLVHLMDLGLLFDPVNLAIEHSNHLAADNPLRSSEMFTGFDPWVRYLDRKILEEGQDPGLWAGWILDAVGVAVGVQPFHPIWAVPFVDFACVVSGDSTLADLDAMREAVGAAPPERWLEAVGKPVPARPTWLIALCYPASEAKELYRPTSLDAGWFPEHHVSPRSAGGHEITSGFAMDLGGNGRGGKPLGEYIHPQMIDTEFVREASSYVLAAKRLDVSPRSRRVGLLETRERHLFRLNSALPHPVVWS